MRKLVRGAAPQDLTPQLMKELTDKFIADASQRVWNLDFIKSSLLEMSHNKCAYCETLISEESKYMEVEHFHCKGIYKNLVVSWNNLLPSCKRCNGSKGDHDVINGSMIVDPTLDNPKDHLYFKNYRYFEKTIVGEWTIFTLNLNDIKRSIMPRFKVGQKIEETLANTRETVISWEQVTPPGRPLKRVINTLEGLFAETDPDAAYSALAATAILENDHYKQIRSEMIQMSIWTDALENSHISADQILLSGP